MEVDKIGGNGGAEPDRDLSVKVNATTASKDCEQINSFEVLVQTTEYICATGEPLSRPEQKIMDERFENNGRCYRNADR